MKKHPRHYTPEIAPSFNIPDDPSMTGHGMFMTSWKKNFKFHDTLEISGMEHGQSAKYLLLVSMTTGKKYTMFVRDVIDMIRNATIDHGKIEAWWTFTKRGQNYGVAVLEMDEPARLLPTEFHDKQ